jgi:hypothetical protein
MSWVTLDRICQERVDKDGVRLELVRNGRPLRSSALKSLVVGLIGDDRDAEHAGHSADRLATG